MKFGGNREKKRPKLRSRPSASAMAKVVKGTTESAEESGFDGWKKIKGRKHHIAIDTTGCVLAMTVHAASGHDSQGARPLFGQLFGTVPTVK